MDKNNIQLFKNQAGNLVRQKVFLKEKQNLSIQEKKKRADKSDDLRIKILYDQNNKKFKNKQDYKNIATDKCPRTVKSYKSISKRKIKNFRKDGSR